MSAIRLRAAPPPGMALLRAAAPFGVLLALATPGHSQEDPVLGRLDGREIRFSAVAPSVLDVYGAQDLGMAALENRIQSTLVEIEARNRNLSVRDTEVEEQWQLVAETLRQSTGGERTLEGELEEHGLDPAEFREGLRQALLCTRMIREDFGMSKDAEVPPEKQAVWYEEQKVRHRVRTNVEGCAAVVGEVRIPRAEWAWSIYQRLDEKQQAKLFDDHVATRLIFAAARRSGVEITPQDVDEELARRDEELRLRLEEAGHPAEGVRYVDMLRSKGTDPRTVIDSELFRVNVLQRKLAAAHFGADGYRKFFEEHREDLAVQYGERVGLATIYLLAGTGPNSPRDFVRAEEDLAALRQRLEEEATSLEERIQGFRTLVRVYSEHESATRGGEVGALTRAVLEQGGLPTTLLDEEIGALVGPVRVAGGCHLFLVTRKLPALRFEELGEVLEREARHEYTRMLENESRIERPNRPEGPR